MMRPASSATFSGLNAERPCASVSALTNSSTFNDPRSSRGAAVDFPAPFGPPKTTTAGDGITGSCSESNYRQTFGSTLELDGRLFRIPEDPHAYSGTRQFRECQGLELNRKHFAVRPPPSVAGAVPSCAACTE